MDTPISLAVITLLLAANGFFVAAEFALVKARYVRIQRLADEGNSSARLTLTIQNNLEEYLSACQLGITMASLGLGWVGEPAVSTLLEPGFSAIGLPEEITTPAAFTLGFLTLSSLHIIIGEQLPKTIALRQAEPVSLWIAYPLQLCFWATWPLNWILNKTTGKLLFLFGVKESTHADIYTVEELHFLLKSSSEHGHISESKATMLNNMFEFYDRQVASVMIPRPAVTTLDISKSAQDNINIVNKNLHSRFPVIDGKGGDRIVGLILVKDVQRFLIMGGDTSWEELLKLCRPPLIVPESQPIPRLFDTMRSSRAHMALVVDEYGEFIGIVTLEDILEEIVGEIHDETDENLIPNLTKVNENEWIADGLTSLVDLCKEVSIPINLDTEPNTLSGYFMVKLNRLAVPNDQLDIGAYRLTVETMEQRRVGQVRIRHLLHIR